MTDIIFLLVALAAMGLLALYARLLSHM